jgi:Ni/Co efflux regulator RcnB
VERSAPHADRGQRQGGERPQFNAPPQHFSAPNMSPQQHFGNNVPPQEIMQRERFQRAVPQNVGPDPREIEAMRAQRERFQGRQLPPEDRYVRNNPYTRSNGSFAQGERTRVPVVSNIPRPGTQPPARFENRRDQQISWNRDWRRDDRYDWRRWRDRHHDRFHLSIYYDPFGWGYEPFSIGWRLWPNYYASNYWITDPWDYELPYAPPGTQWVRYYNDVLLVDLYSGEVIDVIHDFFW